MFVDISVLSVIFINILFLIYKIVSDRRIYNRIIISSTVSSNIIILLLYFSNILKEYYVIDIVMVYVFLSFVVLIIWQKFFLYIDND